MDKLFEFLSFVLNSKLISSNLDEAASSGAKIVAQNAAKLRASLPAESITYPEFEEFYNEIQLHQLAFEKKVTEAIIKQAPPPSAARKQFDLLDADGTGFLESNNGELGE